MNQKSEDTNSIRFFQSDEPSIFLLVLNVGNGWVAGGCWDDDITSDDWDHSRKFPAFSTSKYLIPSGYLT